MVCDPIQSRMEDQKQETRRLHGCSFKKARKRVGRTKQIYQGRGRQAIQDHEGGKGNMMTYLLGEFVYYLVVSTAVITPVVAGGVILLEKAERIMKDGE